MGREGKRVSKVGHAELRLIELPDDVRIDDPDALAKVAIESWPLWQRVVFGRRARRAIVMAFGDLRRPTE